jgi:AraC-like DNA-binding protein
VTPALAAFLVDVANILCGLLIGLRVLTARPKLTNARLVALICLGAIAYFTLALSDYSAWIPRPYRIEVGAGRPVFNLLRNASPGLTMVLVHRLFTDKGPTPRWLLAAFALQLFLEEPIKWLVPAIRNQPPLGELAPTLLQTLFVGLSLYWTLADWRTDLVEARRRGRVVITAVVLVNIVASSLLLRVVVPQDTLANYQTYVALTVWELVVGLIILLRMSDAGLDRFLDPTRDRAAPAVTADFAAALGRLEALMAEDRLYREPGLSLGRLAERAQLPQYRLRRLIHEQLGYRNFNAYLHAYRIKDACAQLAEPALLRTPILTIALCVGYQSLNTFNRGFREMMGVTPSAYRAEKTGQKLQSDPNFANSPPVAEIGKR